MKEMLITSSVLILAILLLRFLFRRTISRRVQYALWLLVALRLLVPVNLPAMEHNVLSAAEPVSADIEQSLSERIDPALHHTMSDAGTHITQTVTPNAPSVGVIGGADGPTEIFVSGPPLWLTILHFIHFGGMAVMALWFLAANLRFARKLRRTRVLLDGAASRYPVYLCDDIPSPCFFGLFLPTIYVTSAAAKDENRLRYVIAHEETHARHLDPLWSLVRSVCLAVWWFNPLVWLAAYCSKADCELACDEGVLARLGESERVPYGETLLALVPVRRGGDPMLAATTMTAGKRQMKERIQRIAEHKRPFAVALVAVLALTGVVCAATFTGAEKVIAETAQAVPGPAGSYTSVEDYLDAVRDQMTTVTYTAADTGGAKTANVLDTHVLYLEKEAELSGFAPDGTLELYRYVIETRIDAPLTNVAIADSMYLKADGWCDLEGQGGHSLVALRREDGSVDVLFDRPNNEDRGGLYYYEESAEEMLYDWYVRENRLDLPLYTRDLLTADRYGNTPARRVDGEGWYLYVPVQWYLDTDHGIGLRWVSPYATGSILSVKYLASEDECVLVQRFQQSDWVADAERKTLTYDYPQQQLTLTAYLYEAPGGGYWQVLTRYAWATSIYSDMRGLESEMLAAMADSFTLTAGKPPQDTRTPSAPDEVQVLALRERVESGMSEDEIKYLTEMIMVEHYWLENMYLSGLGFRAFNDPNSLAWNYFDRPGEIQIGWAWDVDKDVVCAEEGLSEDEFYAKYGQPVRERNTHDAESFRKRMTALKESVKSGMLDEDFDRMIALCRQAKETHNVGCVIELYQMLHDMDYYLLRYGPSAVGRLTAGPSVASNYYDCLSIWH